MKAEMMGTFAQGAPRSGRVLWALAGMVLLAGCNAILCAKTLAKPGLYMEDAVLFGFYYGHGQPLSTLFASHTGQPYLTVLANGFAWLFSWADVRLQPWLYQWCGFVISVLSSSLLAFSGLVRSRALILLCPLFLGLLGLNHIYYYNTTIYVMYTGVLALFALILFPPPAGRLSLLLQALAFLLLPWSGPFSLLALPATALLFCTTGNRGKRLLYSIGFCSTLAYFFTVQESTVRLANFFHLGVMKMYWAAMVQKILFLDFFHSIPSWAGLVVLAILAGCMLVLARDREYLLLSLALLFFAFASMLLFYLSSKLPMYLHPKLCHRVIATFFWAFLLVLTADRLLVRFGAGPRWQWGCALLFALLLIPDARLHPEKQYKPPVGLIFPFTQTIAFYEQAGLRARKQQVCLDLPQPSSTVMRPRVLVGYTGEYALRLPRSAPEITTGKRFVCPAR